jgi:hypothetical protein
MKRIDIAIQMLALSGLLTAAAAPIQAGETCAKSTVRGVYGSILTGAVPGVGPFATVAVVTFDGNGGWSYTESGNFNGIPIPKQTRTGNYTVAANCTGSSSDSSGATQDFVIVNGGQEIFMVGTGPGAVFTISMKRLSKSED